MFSDAIYSMKPQGVFREGDNNKIGLKQHQVHHLYLRYVFFFCVFFSFTYYLMIYLDLSMFATTPLPHNVSAKANDS
jgi:hypothetical protein